MLYICIYIQRTLSAQFSINLRHAIVFVNQKTQCHSQKTFKIREDR